jgi:hypothetical protein
VCWLLAVLNNIDESAQVRLPLADLEIHLQRPPYIALLHGFPEEADSASLEGVLTVALPLLGVVLLAL